MTRNLCKFAIAILFFGVLASIPSASAAPTVDSVAPNTGPIGGGTNIVITGTGFVAGATVAIGGTAATGVVVNSATEIVATTPAKAAGTYNLVVTLPDTTTYTKANAFTYAATPTITTLSPASGPTAGGTVVTMTGTNFRAGATVTFGGTAGTGIIVNSATEIVVTTPAKTAGSYNVVVTNSDTSTYTKANGFTFGDQPTITAVTPSTVGTAGGASVQVTGTNFRTGATMTVGGTAFTGVTVNSPTELVATAPAKAAGTYNVVVTVDGLSYAKANALTYAPVTNPTVSTLEPATGSTAGGTVVTISGTGFNSGATVTFGGTAGTSVVVASSTQLQVVAPAKTVGTYNVVVTNSDGGSATKLNGWTAVAPPTVSSITPTFGPLAGGTSVSIVGTGFLAGVSVTFDGNPATVTRHSSTSLTAVSPAHPSGSVSVAVVNPDGQTITASTPFQYTDSDTPDAATQVAPLLSDSGKYSTIATVGSTIIIAHGVGGSNQFTLTISDDLGATWRDVFPTVTANMNGGAQLAVHDAQRFAVRVGTNIYVTQNGGTSFTTQAISASNLVGVDLAAGPGGTYVASHNHFNLIVSASASQDISTDYGVTWVTRTLASVGASSCSASFRDVTVAVESATTWRTLVRNTRNNPGGAGCEAFSQILGYYTTNAGVSHTVLPGHSGNDVNDPFNPVGGQVGFGLSFDRQSTTGDRFVWIDSGNVLYAAAKAGNGRYLFTNLGSMTGTHSGVTIAGSAEGATAVLYAKGNVAGAYYELLTNGEYLPGSAFTTLHPNLDNNAANAERYPSNVAVHCPVAYVAYNDLSTDKLKLQVTNIAGATCGSAVVGSTEAVATASVTNLVALDVDPTGMTAIARTENGDKVETWDAQGLGTSNSFDTNCALSGPAAITAAVENVVFLDCNGDDVLRIKSTALADPALPVECSADDADLFDSWNAEGFDESLSQEISDLGYFSVNWEATVPGHCKAFALLVVSTLDGRIGVLTGKFQVDTNPVCVNNPDHEDCANKAFAFKQYTASTAPVLSICGLSYNDQAGDAETDVAIVAVAPTASTVVYEWNQDYLAPALSLYKSFGGALGSMDGVDCTARDDTDASGQDYGRIIVGGGSGARAINTVNGTQMWARTDLADPHTDGVAISYDGNWAAIAIDSATDDLIHIVNATTGETVLTIPLMAGNFRDIALDATGQNLWVATDTTINRYEIFAATTVEPEATCTTFCNGPTVTPTQDVDEDDLIASGGNPFHASDAQLPPGFSRAGFDAMLGVTMVLGLTASFAGIGATRSQLLATILALVGVILGVVLATILGYLDPWVITTGVILAIGAIFLFLRFGR